MNFEVFDVDFIRRVTPPSLKQQGLPADGRLKLYITESIVCTSAKGSRVATDIYLYNPITNALEGSITHQHHQLLYSPHLTTKQSEESTLVFPLGYYPVATLRNQASTQSISLTATAMEDSQSRLDLHNQLEQALYNLCVKIEYPDGLKKYPAIELAVLLKILAFSQGRKFPTT